MNNDTQSRIVGLATDKAPDAAHGCVSTGPKVPVDMVFPCANEANGDDPVAWFRDMIDHCYDFAAAAQAAGRPLVGTMCEFTPREVILAAGAVPVCLCGGSAETIAAAEQHLPSILCPLIKSTYGYHLTGRNPFLKWAKLVVAETTCDGKKKMYELLSQSKPVYVLELPQKADDPEALEHWIKEVRKLKEYLERLFEVQITDKRLREAIHLMNRERSLRRQLAGLMSEDPPPLTGRQLLEFQSIISGLEPDLRQYEKALRFFGTRPGRAERVGAINGAEPPARERPNRSRVRVLLTGVPLVHGAERILELIEDCGAVVVCQENCSGIKPILEDVDANAPDPMRAIAEKYYHLPCSVMTVNQRRFALLRALASQFKADCVIELVWQGCLTYDVESYQIRKLAEEELRLPYLKIVTDYSPSDSARLRTRIEALLERTRNA